MWWMFLAGCGPAPAPYAVPVMGAMTSPTQFPVDPDAPTVFHALDNDPSTAWQVQPGDVGTFTLATLGADAVRLDTTAKAVWIQSYQLRLRNRGHAPWKRYDIVPGKDVRLPANDHNSVELRFEESAEVRTVSLRADEPPEFQTNPYWTYQGARNGNGEAPDSSAMLIGEVNLKRCSVGPMSMPAYTHFQGECRRTATGLTLNGKMNGQPLRTTVRFHRLSNCLALVEGWPLSRCD